MEFETTGVEVQEVAEPAEGGVEVQEVAEPAKGGTTDSGKTKADAAFAAQRREIEEANKRAVEAERKLAEMEAVSNARNRAMERLAGNADADITALAEHLGIDTGDITATLDAERESARKDLVIAQLQEELQSINADAEMQRDLAALQKIAPDVKNLDELGTSFANYINAGLSAEEAYYAVKAKETATKDTPPPVIGKVDNKPPEKDFFTEAEVDAMTPSEQKANADKIIASMGKWK